MIFDDRKKFFIATAILLAAFCSFIVFMLINGSCLTAANIYPAHNESFDNICKNLKKLERKDMIVHSNRSFSIPDKGTGELKQFFNSNNLSYGIRSEKRGCCFKDNVAMMNKQYDRSMIIGETNEKSVYRVKCNKCKNEYALHAMDKCGAKAYLEVYFLQYLQKRAFPHIITFYHLYYDDRTKNLIIFTELLDEVLEINHILFKIDENYLLKIAEELALAIGYLHMNNIIHSDIKPRNVGLKDGKIVLFDFNVSANYTAGYDMFKGYTIPYAPYEVLKNGRNTHKKMDFGVDWYGYGLVLYELSIGKFSFDIYGSNDYFIERAKNMEDHLNFTGKYGKDFDDFIKVLVLPSERRRIGYGKDGFRRIVEHPYIKKSKLFERFKQLVNENINN